MSVRRITPQPLLRSPPFPWVPSRVAAVSRAAMPARAPSHAPLSECATRDALFAAIRAARVGGAFWLGPTTTAFRTILAPRDARQEQAMRDGLADGAATESCLVLPFAQRDVDPWSLLVGAELVVADADDEIAALAVIAGTPVRLHGVGRFRSASGQVCADAVFRHLCRDTAYRDPFTGAAATAVDAVALLADWRRTIDANRRVTGAVGIAWWKRRAIRQFLWAPRADPLRFPADVRAITTQASGGGAIAAWPSRTDRDDIDAARAAGTAIALIEDGFVRSDGLGSALHRPWSVTLDWRAAHFDAARASDLEVLLATTPFEPALLMRAAALRRTIVAAGVGKYGVDPELIPTHQTRTDLIPRPRRRVLAIGQVRGDESLRLGGCGLEEPLDFLRAVRAAEPDAEIWYRPHPDVEAGFRDGAIPDAVALRHADRIVRSGSLRAAMAAVDALHVVTSLAGFEGLMAEHDVVVHGTPFYAGWSLTHDLHPCPRRTRRLSLDELTAATLILYPRYIDPMTLLPCSPEVLVARLRVGRRRHTTATRLRALDGLARRAARHLTLR